MKVDRWELVFCSVEWSVSTELTENPLSRMTSRLIYYMAKMDSFSDDKHCLYRSDCMGYSRAFCGTWGHRRDLFAFSSSGFACLSSSQSVLHFDSDLGR